MTGFVQLLNDTLALVRTDRRIWSACGFIVVAALVWQLTSVWRQPIAESEVHKGKPPEERGAHYVLVDFQQDWAVEKKRQAEFHELLKRETRNLSLDKDEIEQSANRLVDKLNTITMKVDRIIADIGTTRLGKAQLNEKIAKQKSSKSKKVIQIDRSELDTAR